MATIQRTSAYVAQSALADVTYDPERSPALQFIISGRNGSSGAILVKPLLSLSNGTQAAPPSDKWDLASKGIILLPARVEPPGDLAGDLETFVQRFVDIPPLWVKILVRYVLLTWVFDKFTALPYLRFLGEPQSGKTRCLQVASALCYKSISVAGASSGSSIFRLADSWRGTLSVDEADFRGDLYADIIKLLNQGYMGGQFVTRSEKEGTSYEARGFNIYGPKILTTRKEFEDHALESRCLTLRMPDAAVRAGIPRQLPVSFAAESAELRNRCLGWRFAMFDLVDMDESEIVHLAPRTAQISLPLWAVSKLILKDEKFRKDFLRLVGDAGDESRSITPPAVVVEALRRVTVNEINFPIVLSVKDLREVVAEVCVDWGLEELKLGTRAVGTLVRSFGLATFKSRGGAWEFALTKAALGELVAKYSPAS